MQIDKVYIRQLDTMYKRLSFILSLSPLGPNLQSSIPCYVNLSAEWWLWLRALVTIK